MLQRSLDREMALTDSFRALPGIRAEELLAEKLRPVDAVPTGFASWSKACRDAGGGIGIARGWHIVVAARTGSGKSIFGLNLAREAMIAGEQVFFLSLEMSGVQVETRFLAIASDTPVHKLEQGEGFDRHAFVEAHDELEKIMDLNGGVFYCNQQTMRSLPEVLDAMRWARENRDCRYFVMDYLQLAAKDQNDPGLISEVSHEIRRLAQELNVVSVCLSQFNRETSKSGKEQPSIHGLMGGSAIENDADQVILIDHSRIEKKHDGFASYIMLAKNRHGPTNADIKMHFNTRTLRMFEP